LGKKLEGTEFGKQFPFIAKTAVPLMVGLAVPNLPGGEGKEAKKLSELLPGIQATKKIVPNVPTNKLSDSLPLIQEAKKYKTAEEFVNSKKILYHGTNQDFDKFVKSDLGKSTGAISAKEGFFFTDDMSEAQNYANVADSKMVANFKKFQKQSEKYAKMVEEAENQAQRTGD
jgi:hypothetical protein